MMADGPDPFFLTRNTLSQKSREVKRVSSENKQKQVNTCTPTFSSAKSEDDATIAQYVL